MATLNTNLKKLQSYSYLSTSIFHAFDEPCRLSRLVNFSGNIKTLKLVNQWYFLVNPVMHEIADTENLHSRKLISDMHLFNVMVDLMAQN